MKAHKTDRATLPTIRILIQFDLPKAGKAPAPLADAFEDLEPGQDFFGWTYDEIDAMPLGVFLKKPGA